jgi:hypothetical protein
MDADELRHLALVSYVTLLGDMGFSCEDIACCLPDAEKQLTPASALACARTPRDAIRIGREHAHSVVHNREAEGW